MQGSILESQVARGWEASEQPGRAARPAEGPPPVAAVGALSGLVLRPAPCQASGSAPQHTPFSTPAFTYLQSPFHSPELKISAQRNNTTPARNWKKMLLGLQFMALRHSMLPKDKVSHFYLMAPEF